MKQVNRRKIQMWLAYAQVVLMGGSFQCNSNPEKWQQDFLQAMNNYDKAKERYEVEKEWYENQKGRR